MPYFWVRSSSFKTTKVNDAFLSPWNHNKYTHSYLAFCVGVRLEGLFFSTQFYGMKNQFPRIFFWLNSFIHSSGLPIYVIFSNLRRFHRLINKKAGVHLEGPIGIFTKLRLKFTGFQKSFFRNECPGRKIYTKISCLTLLYSPRSFLFAK